MATSTYIYKSGDTLIKLADRFNTTVDTLVRLNTWLKDPNTGKTHVDPNNSYTIQKLNVSSYATSFKFTVYPYNKGISAEALTEDSCKVIYNQNSDNKLIDLDGNILGEINFSNGTINIKLPLKQFKYIKLRYKPNYWPDRIILPLVGSGNTSMEDYWQVMNNVTGINYREAVSNFEASQTADKYSTTIIGLDFDYYTVESMELIENVGQFNPNSGSISSVNSLGLTSSMFIGSQLHDQFNQNLVKPIDTNGAANSQFISQQTNQPYAINSPSVSVTDYNIVDFNAILNRDINNAVNNKPDPINTNGNPKKAKDYYLTSAKSTKMTIQVGNNTIYLPVVPDSISDSAKANYSSQDVLGLSEPYTIYRSTDARVLTFTVTLHRDMNDLSKGGKISSDDVLERIAGVIQSGTYPSYSTAAAAALRTKVKVLDQVSISGIMLDADVEWSGPIMSDVDKHNVPNWMGAKYSVLTLKFTVQEVNSTAKSASNIIGRWTGV